LNATRNLHRHRPQAPRRASGSVLAASLAGLALVALIPSATLAASSIDLSYLTVNNAMNVLDLSAQTFTADVTGSLTQIDLVACAVTPKTSGTLYVSLQGVDGSGFPNGVNLSTGSLVVDNTCAVPKQVPMSAVSITSGTQYAIVFYIDDTTTTVYEVKNNVNNPYSGGQALYRDAGVWIANMDGTYDRGFQTWVDPAATSSPSASASASASAAGASSSAASSVTPPPTAAGTGSGGASRSFPIWLLPVAMLAGSALILRVRRQGR
jgi:hypothetical protein